MAGQAENPAFDQLLEQMAEEPNIWSIADRVTDHVLSSVPGWAVFLLIAVCIVPIAWRLGRRRD